MPVQLFQSEEQIDILAKQGKGSDIIWKLPNNPKIVLYDTQNTVNVF